MANYASCGEADWLTADLEKQQGGPPLGVLDRETRGFKLKSGVISDFSRSHPIEFQNLEEAALQLKKLKRNSDELPLITVDLGAGSLQKILINGTKKAIEEYFDCAFRFLPDSKMQVGASLCTFEVFDEEKLRS